MRLDKHLSEKYSELSRTKIQKMIKNGDVLVDGEKVAASFKLNGSEKINVKEAAAEDFTLKAEDLSLDVVFEDGNFLIINKPYGMVVHPSDTGHRSGTVVNALLDKIKPEFGDSVRPGIVHRLDKDTSGLLIVAKNLKTYEYFVEIFKARKIKKGYLALVVGRPEHPEGIIDSPIVRDETSRKKMTVMSNKASKKAVTAYKVIEEFGATSLIEVDLKTGRTHQIRVHMAAIGYPVVMDTVYGKVGFNRKFKEEFGLGRQFLHAFSLSFISPTTKKKVDFKSDLPSDLKQIIEAI